MLMHLAPEPKFVMGFDWHIAHTDFEGGDRLEIIGWVSGDEASITGRFIVKAAVEVEHDPITQEGIYQVRKATKQKINFIVGASIKTLR